mgnify:CR=1 FL=1
MMNGGEDRNMRELCQMIGMAVAIIILGIVGNRYFPELAKILNYACLVVTGIVIMPLIWGIGGIIEEKKSKKS